MLISTRRIKGVKRTLTSTIGEIRFGTKGSAASMTRAEICETVVAANWFDVGHGALATKVASGSEIDLKWFVGQCAAVVIRYSCPSHLDVVTTEEKQQTVAQQTNDI